MIRSLLRAVKRFLWKHAGIVQLTENHAATQFELSRLRTLLDRHTQVLCELTASTAPLPQLATVPRRLEVLRETAEQLHAEMARRSEAEQEQRRQLAEAWRHQVLDAIRSTLAEQRDALARHVTETAAEQQAHLQRLVGDSAQHVRQELTALQANLQRCLDTLTERLGTIQGALPGLFGSLEHIGRAISEGRAENATQHELYRCHAELTQQVTSVRDQLAQVSESQQERLTALLEEVQGWGLDRWRIREYGGLMRYFRRKYYQQDIAGGRLPVPRLQTSHPLAALSNDTLFPRGAKNDNSICPRFNRKLYALLGDKPRLKVLDFGCAGGGLVRSLLDDGHIAVGLEGSPYPRENQLGEWATIPHHLHTCDITQPFTIFDPATDLPMQFDAISAWEVMEHIPEEALPGFFANLRKHLAPDGYFLCSVATFLDHDAAAGVIWHVTVKPREWWAARFREAGFDVCIQDTLGKDDWLRGSGHCRGDWHEDQNLGFHLVVRHRAAAALAAA